jgi:hypothetical protein
MLSAFTARPIVELKQRDKSKIESILAYGTSYPPPQKAFGANNPQEIDYSSVLTLEASAYTG